MKRLSYTIFTLFILLLSSCPSIPKTRQIYPWGYYDKAVEKDSTTFTVNFVQFMFVSAYPNASVLNCVDYDKVLNIVSEKIGIKIDHSKLRKMNMDDHKTSGYFAGGEPWHDFKYGYYAREGGIILKTTYSYPNTLTISVEIGSILEYTTSVSTTENIQAILNSGNAILDNVEKDLSSI